MTRPAAPAFTPGPWRLVWHGTERYPFPLSVLSGDGERWITRDGQVSSEANARLIASAPELLKACEAALQHALSHVYMGPRHGICSLCETEWPSSEGERHESDCLVFRLRAVLYKIEQGEK